METSRPLSSRHKSARGFSLTEVLIAISILVVGVVSLAGLFSRMDSTSGQSRYIGTAAILASEKLEDLVRAPMSDPQIAVPGGGSAGSLTDDVCCKTVNGSNVDYFDEVLLSAASGSVAETYNSSSSTFQTTTQSPDGKTVQESTSTPPVSGDTLTFKRRWLIEQDPVINGITITNAKRITVLVTIPSLVGKQAVNYQMSMVRQ